jgi:SprT protein
MKSEPPTSLKRREKPKSELPCGVDDRLSSKIRHLLEKLACPGMAAKAYVRWNKKLTSTAGTACVRTGRVDLNPQVIRFGKEQIRRILRHEVAHLAAHERAGRRGMRLQTHGPEWRLACEELGIGGESAYHDLPLRSRVMEPKFFYQCPWCLKVVKRVRKYARCTACYDCCKAYSNGVYDPRFKFQRLE